MLHKTVGKSSGTKGFFVNQRSRGVKIQIEMITGWLSDVSHVLAETLEADEMNEADNGGGLAGGANGEGISLIEELLTDFFQLIHAR